MGKRKRRGKPKSRPPAAAGPVRKAPTADPLRPWLLAACCALFVARPLFPSESAAAEGDGMPMVMLWLLLGVAWILIVVSRRAELRVRFGWVDAAVVVLVGLHTASSIWGAYCGSPRPAVNMLWEWIGYGLCFFLARQLLTGPREIRAAVVVMIALAVAVAGYGVYQSFVEMPATEEW